MRHYEIYVASARYQKQEPLTYVSDDTLCVGDVVVIPLGRVEALGFIHAEVPKPNFACKPIVRKVKDIILPRQSRELYAWLQKYYPSGSGPALQLFLPSILLTKKAGTLDVSPLTTEVKNSSSVASTVSILPKLSAEQTAALEQMSRSQKPHYILHGETGSGKTRVYIERTKACIKAQKSAIILTPEIGLTPQLAATFAELFGEKVIIMHSNLTAKTRREYWLRIATSTEPLVIIGPRSALFSPLAAVGLIVVDEFHEPAYKQEQVPRYQTVRVAAALASLHAAEIIYGSATPPVADYYVAEKTSMPIIRMLGSARGNMPTSGDVDGSDVDIKISNLADKSEYTRHPFISNALLKAIEKSLANKEQILVYLNRRGTARLVICQGCGWQALCPRCDLPLTYHGDGHHLRCHTCGYVGEVPLSCPVCASTELQYRTMGTKALLETLHKFFPNASLQRFDTDLGVADRMDKHYDNVLAGNIDILVGTQMLGKGLDLPKLGLVGVIAADTSLYMPDFSASERSYQLLHQVLGRVGRGHRKGKVIIQTYVPDNPVLQAAIAKDYNSFYAAEMIDRKTFMFPPFCYLLKISVSRKTSQSAEKSIRILHRTLETTKLTVRLSDPAPSFYEHTHGLYHWQLVLKSKDRNELLKAISALPSGNWTYDLDPANLL